MRLPVIQGTIRRRILANFRVDACSVGEFFLANITRLLSP